MQARRNQAVECGATPQRDIAPQMPLLRRRSLFGVTGVLCVLRQRQSGAPWEHHDARCFEPGGPRQPSGLGPKRKGVGCLNKPAECLERGHCLQNDWNLFSVTAWRPAVKDLNIQVGQVRGCLRCIDDRALGCGAFELAQGCLPPTSNTAAIAAACQGYAPFGRS